MFIDKREFTAAALNEISEIFVVHVTALKTPGSIRMTIHPSRPQVALLQVHKALIKIPLEYLNYAVVFFFDFAIELLESNDINDHAMEWVEGMQPPY